MLGKWSPQEVRSMYSRLESIINVVFATSGKEEGLKAHVMEQGSISLSMSKRVNIPSYSWGNSELLAEPLVTLNKVLDNILIVGSTLICMNPSSHEDLESALFNKFLKSFLSFLSGSNVPHVKEFHLNKSELSCMISLHLENDLGDDLFDSSMSSSLFHTCEVLIICFLPSHVIVTVRNHVHSKVLVLVFPWVDFWEHLMGISLPSHMHVNDFYLL
jgi:hypothetical protein